MPTDEERQERVLHARISESLERELKDRARLLGMSVSNIVRNVLASSFGLVEEIVSDSADIARAVAGEHATPRAGTSRRERAPVGEAMREPAVVPREPAVVLGWQDVRLALNAVCADCNAILPRGVAAAIAVYGRPGPQTILCPTCRDRRLRPDAANPRDRGDDHEKGRANP
jgi:hypothetical protein